MGAEMDEKEVGPLFTIRNVEVMHVHNYHAAIEEAAPTNGELHSINVNTRNEDLKKWVDKTAKQIELAENQGKYGNSTLGREAFILMRELMKDGNFKRRHKLLTYMKSVIAMLDSLP